MVLNAAQRELTTAIKTDLVASSRAAKSALNVEAARSTTQRPARLTQAATQKAPAAPRAGSATARKSGARKVAKPRRRT